MPTPDTRCEVAGPCQERQHSRQDGLPNIADIYVKNCSVYIQCKGDIVVVDIKQHKSQF